MHWLLSFLTGPIIKGALDAYQAKLASGNTTDRIAAELAGRELEVQGMEAKARSELKIAQVGHWYEPEKLFAYITLVFYSKVLIWDKCLGWGTTDAIAGTVADWAGLVIAFYFGKRGAENIARIVGSRFGR